MSHADKVKQFITGAECYSNLLKENKLSDYGVWKVTGEDPNADLGGYHHNPLIGYAEGTLEDVIAWAVEQPRWYAWGRGGHIERWNPKIVKVNKNTLKEETKLRRRQSELEAELEELKKRIGT